MKRFLLNDPEKWMHQNQAGTTGDFVEGCLLDNFIVQCKHGVAALYEHYCNCWSSCYEVHFARTESEARDLFEEFYTFQKRCEEETA